MRRRQQRAGRLLLVGLGCAVAGLVWALAHDRRLTLAVDVLLGVGSVSVVVGAVVGLSTLTWGSDRRRRRARRLARARSTEVERED